jgi:hypothetical protein
MGTRLWGPDTWYVIHVIADSAPDTLSELDKKNYRRFYESLGNVLPCPSCGVHYKQFLEKDPPTFDTRVDMIRWTIRAHNHSNVQTGSPVLDEDEAFKRIEQEIKARENGIVRGRIPTMWESCTDMFPPAVIAALLVLAVLSVYKSVSRS